MTTNIHFLSYLAHFGLEWDILQKIVVQKIRKKHFAFSNIFVFEYRVINETM